VTERRLAAIMFTDIAGYTAITQSSESHALELLDRHNKLLRPMFSKFGGKEIKTIGDSFLVEFDSALDAVNCAVQIQQSLQAYNAESPDDWKINIRIGIHLGDIIRKQGDVFGDAVNISSRIQPLADVGGICVSQQVYDQVQNKIDFLLERLDHVELKNVKFPIDVYKLILTTDGTSKNSGKLENRNKIRLAVLPFVNMSPNQEDEYFADGLTEELIAELAGVEGLSVISRTSIMHYKNSNKKILEIGNELKVGTVLEGSIRKAGNKIRVTAQLIDSTNDDHLWADRYDRELSDIFAVQDEIAKNVTSALRSKLVSTKIPQTKHTSDMVAYNLYLQGRYFWNKRSKESVKKALELFQQALARDPEFAQPYSGIADCYSIMADRGDIPAAEAFSKSIDVARKAVQLNQGLAEAHASLGLSLLRNYKWESAKSEFKKAIELNPSYASAHQWHAHVLLDTGRLEEAKVELEKASEADPLSPVILQNLSYLYDSLKQFDRAIETVDRALEIQPHAMLYMTSAYIHADMGDRERALKDIERFESTRDSASAKADLGLCYARLGMREKARELLEESVELSKDVFIQSSRIGFLYGILGDLDECYKYLFRAADDGTLIVRILLYDEHFANVRADPRFKVLLRRCNLPESVVIEHGR